jgi:hypothetical protein
LWKDHRTLILGNRYLAELLFCLKHPLTSNEVLSSPGSDQGGQSPNTNLVLTSPPLPASTTKPKDRTRSHHRVKKQSKSKKREPSPQSPSINRDSREPSSMLGESGPNMVAYPPSYAYQDQIYSGGSSTHTIQQPPFMQYQPPLYQNMQPPMPGPQAFGTHPTAQTLHNANTYQTAYSSQPSAGYSVSYSSRVEDVVSGPIQQQENTDPNQIQMSPQYMMPPRDSIWRATS